MTEKEIGGLIVASLIIGLLVSWFVYILVLMFKNNHGYKKSKKERIKELEHKFEVLEFKIENQDGFRLRQELGFGNWKIDYIQFDTIKTIDLPFAVEYKIKGNYIVDEDNNKYKFDKENGILIKIEKIK